MKIPRLSDNKTIRRGQMRSIAKEAMAADGWGASDPIGKVASVLEAVYQAGKHHEELRATPLDPVPWEAIPLRSREILRTAVHFKEHWNDLFTGPKAIVLMGASASTPRHARDNSHWKDRGARTWMILAEITKGTVRELERVPGDWPASSASALVRLGIFEECGTPEQPAARLTVKGMNTFDEALRLSAIFN